MKFKPFSLSVRVLVIALAFSVLWWPLVNHEFRWLEILEEELYRMSGFMSIFPFHFPEIWDMTEKSANFTFFPNSGKVTQLDQSLQDMGNRISTVPYFSAFGAMLETAWTRVNMLFVILLASSPLMIAAFLWGIYKRKTNYDNFKQCYPLLFRAVFTVVGWTLLIIANLVVLPWIVPSWVLVAFVLLIAWFVYWLTANFHLF